VLGIDCPVIAEDLHKLFEVYWYLTDNPVPDQYPASLDTLYNSTRHMMFNVDQDSSAMDAFLVVGLVYIHVVGMIFESPFMVFSNLLFVVF